MLLNRFPELPVSGAAAAAVIGSVYASLYAGRMTAALPAQMPAALARAAHQSVGAALTIAARLGHTGQSVLADRVHQVASGAFIHGLSAGCLVAGGGALAGAIMAAILLPAQPAATAAPRAPGRSRPATAVD